MLSNRLRWALAILPVVLLLFGVVSPVAAAQPVKGPVDVPTRIIDENPAGCGTFKVKVEPLFNKEHEIDFYDQAGNLLFIIVSGGIKVRFTNLSTNHFLDFNVSGQTRYIFNPDGTISVFTAGPSFWWFSDGPDVAPGQPLLGLYYGQTESVFNDTGFHFLSSVGPVKDLCALLAGA